MNEKNRDSKTSIAVLATATTVLGLAFPVLAITVRHAASAIQFALALTCVAALVTRPWRQLRLRRGQGAAVAWIFGAWPLLVGGHMLLNGYFDGPALERALRFALAAMALCVLTHLRATPLRRIGTAFALGAIGSVYVALESCWHALPGQLLQCRASNGFTNPVPFGGMALTLGMCALASLRFEFPHLSRLDRIVRAVGAACGLLACGLSQTRGAWIAAPVLLIIAAAPWHATWRAHLRPAGHFVLIPLVALLVSAIAIFGDTFMLRFHEAMSDVAAYRQGATHSSIGARLEMWRTATDIWRQEPWFGAGAGQWPQALAQQEAKGLADSYIKGFSHPHNDYLQMLTESGIAGLALLLATYATPAAYAWQRRHATDTCTAMSAHMCILVCTAIAIFSLTESMLQIKFQVAFFSCLMSLCLAGALAPCDTPAAAGKPPAI
ncbi:LPS ligase-like protein [Bordetella ansorpii]|uniref:LPS ligase-like protein n=1 Tax=Bordetella ansorpii TaxID=288768 RepID=A0A157RID7_9BORD|nr:O-antigen ligase family protein [Bordetella ansorpii]SAI57189.1 LPS ligase-like protein [Bordetella ansorpii]